jgi:hypothetical protein
MMGKRVVAGVIVATAALPFLTPVASAQAAQEPRNSATVISHVTIDKSDSSLGYVRAQYRCQPEIDHLWVSVKQTADRTADPALTQEGSGFGKVAATWLQSHPVALQCDGSNHVQTFAVNTTEQIPPEFGGGTVGYGQLGRGQAYVQFCLTSSTDEHLFLADMNFQQVR